MTKCKALTGSALKGLRLSISVNFRSVIAISDWQQLLLLLMFAFCLERTFCWHCHYVISFIELININEWIVAVHRKSHVQWWRQAWAWGFSPKMSLSPPPVKQTCQETGGELCEIFKIVIVSAVKIRKQRLQAGCAKNEVRWLWEGKEWLHALWRWQPLSWLWPVCISAFGSYILCFGQPHVSCQLQVRKNSYVRCLTIDFSKALCC